MVWLHCDGEGDPDKENIGSVSYTPWRGFPAYFFPYWNQGRDSPIFKNYS
jgi:sodium/potassium-transporting ATPase subunit beta